MTLTVWDQSASRASLLARETTRSYAFSLGRSATMASLDEWMERPVQRRTGLRPPTESTSELARNFSTSSLHLSTRTSLTDHMRVKRKNIFVPARPSREEREAISSEHVGRTASWAAHVALEQELQRANVRKYTALNENNRRWEALSTRSIGTNPAGEFFDPIGRRRDASAES